MNKNKAYLIGVLITTINLLPIIASCNENTGETINDESCVYSIYKEQLIRHCEKPTQSINSDQINTPPSTQEKSKSKAIKHSHNVKEPQRQQKPPTLKNEENNDLLIANIDKTLEALQIINNPFIYVLGAFILGFLFGRDRTKRGEDYLQDQAEKLVREVLKGLDKSIYYVMHDITLPILDGTTQIDHIVFSKHGIFVIETKSHKAWIFGNEKDALWTQVMHYGMNFTFYNPIKQNANHIKHIGNLVSIDPSLMTNIVVFTNPTVELKTPLPGYVLTINLLKSYIENAKSDLLSTQKIHEIIGCIEFNRKERSIETNNDHIAFVKSRFKSR